VWTKFTSNGTSPLWEALGLGGTKANMMKDGQH
jgi:hypothetical protein